MLAWLALTSSALFAQNPVTLFGTNAPVVVDSANPNSILLGVRIFSDVAGQVLGCSFYKAPTNTGPHVVSLWDSAGKLLATQTATVETASGMQSVRFASPVPMAAKQIFTCGYFAPHGHYSNDRNVFTAQKDVPPLHIPVNGGVYRYGTEATTFPTTVYLASNYWVDVLFQPSTTGAMTWISATQSRSDSGPGGHCLAREYLGIPLNPRRWHRGHAAVRRDGQQDFESRCHVVGDLGNDQCSGIIHGSQSVFSNSVIVTAISRADASKSVFSTLTVNAEPAVLAVNPTSLNFAAQTGASSVTPAA